MNEQSAAQNAIATTKTVADQLVLQLCMIINPAPLVDAEHQDGCVNHRNNTPWYIHFPSQNVTVMVTDERTGEPRVGYYPEREAENQALTIWNAMRENQELRADLKARSKFPSLEPGYKIMYRPLNVVPMPE
jgi:hypothetical protein